ncbi:TPA: helix-turn-helix domain-containing protein [Morganella morganii]
MVSKIKNNVNVSVGKNIKKVRKSLGLSGNELGKILGVSQQQVSRYESGTSAITIDTLIRISNALNISVNKLITDYLNYEYDNLLIK